MNDMFNDMMDAFMPVINRIGGFTVGLSLILPLQIPIEAFQAFSYTCGGLFSIVLIVLNILKHIRDGKKKK